VILHDNLLTKERGEIFSKSPCLSVMLKNEKVQKVLKWTNRTYFKMWWLITGIHLNWLIISNRCAEAFRKCLNSESSGSYFLKNDILIESWYKSWWHCHSWCTEIPLAWCWDRCSVCELNAEALLRTNAPLGAVECEVA
jgi:hypothetical protein